MSGNHGVIEIGTIKKCLWPLLLAASMSANANMASQAHRAQSAGVDVVTYPTSVKDVVTVIGAMPGGDAMLDRGTKALDKFAIADRLENVGAEISFGVGTQSLEVHARCLKKDLPLVLGLVAAELRTPALQAAEFAKAKEQFIGSLQSSLHNTEGRAQEAFGSAVFPVGHPNRPHSIADYLAAAKSATLEEVRAFHAKYYGPAHLTLVFVGDVQADDTQAEVAKVFAGWSGGQDYIRPANPAAPAGPREITVKLADKPSVTVILGQATGLTYKDPDTLALRMGTAIFGHGFTGRLMGTVRDKEGLTYNIGAGVSQDTIADGAWDIGASFAPALLDKGIESTRRELQKWWSGGVTDAELADHKQGLIGGYHVGLSTTAGLAGAIITTIQRGYDLDWLDGYPEALKALTAAQVNKAIKAHLNPDSMILVEAGSVK
jgi:zinc protease